MDGNGVSRWFWTIPVAIFLYWSHYGAFWAGGEQAKRAAAKPVELMRVTPAQNPPPSLYPCDDNGRQEYARTCRAQKRMTAIGLQ